MRKEGFTFVIDILGEATVNEVEAEEYVESYIKLLENLKSAQSGWTAIDPGDGDRNMDWGHSPKVNVAVKPSGLYSQAKPKNFEGTVEKFYGRMKRIDGIILKNHERCHLACASHNIRSIPAVMEMAEEFGTPESAYEFQVLYGMAEPVRKGLRKIAKRIRL